MASWTPGSLCQIVLKLERRKFQKGKRNYSHFLFEEKISATDEQTWNHPKLKNNWGPKTSTFHVE